MTAGATRDYSALLKLGGWSDPIPAQNAEEAARLLFSALGSALWVETIETSVVISTPQVLLHRGPELHDASGRQLPERGPEFKTVEMTVTRTTKTKSRVRVKPVKFDEVITLESGEEGNFSTLEGA